MSRKQEIFDKVVTHLRKQGRKARDTTDENCVYLAPNGDKCAAGCLIPPDDYRAEFELGAVHPDGINAVSVYFKSKFSEDEVKLIRQLQNIHDSALSWEFAFSELALEHSLTLPEVTQ